MVNTVRHIRCCRFVCSALFAFLFLAGQRFTAAIETEAPVRIIVMDPLCNRLACGCVKGYAQRDYESLAKFLGKKLDRPVALTYTESLLGPNVPRPEQMDVIIGKYSVVRFDARRVKLSVRNLALLSGNDGKISQSGLFVVRQDDPAQSVADLRGRRILFGPAESAEKYEAALTTLDVFGLPVPAHPLVNSSCNTAAVAVVEREADAAVISSYAMPLLQGCGTIDKGALRVIGETAAVPFISVFATARISAHDEKEILKALSGVAADPGLLAALESKSGFVPSGRTVSDSGARGWTDWRGPNRDAISSYVPGKLPKEGRLLWSRVLTGHGLSGLTVQGDHLIVADKDLDGNRDVFRCLETSTGHEVWKVEYPAPGQMDFTNSPRATPVIHDGLAYLLGAYGQLHCVQLATGSVVWKHHLAEDFGARVPTWGYCSTPLVIGDNVIVNPGAKDASVVALDRRTGEIVWRTPGEPPGYASFVAARIHGVPQIIGYEAAAMCGWDPQTGRRLWRLVPKIEGDFNVPTPVVAGDRLLVSTENNGTRLFGFDRRGRIISKPLAQNDDLSPDTSTPVVYHDLVLGSAGGLVCLDLSDNLKTLWESVDDPYLDYCSLIAGNGRFLIMTQTGSLRLLKADKRGPQLISQLDLFNDVSADDRDVWSCPALVGNRLYVRNSLAVYCFILN